MENKNTFYFKSNIVECNEPVDIVPEVGDEFIFVHDKELAMKDVVEDHDKLDPEWEPVVETYNSDEFISGCVKCNPLTFGGKKFGLVGYKVRLTDKITERRFYLYEIE